MSKKVDRNNLEMKNYEETKKKDVVDKIEDEKWLTDHELNECPYCGDKMELGFVGLNYNHYSHVSYICPSCGAQSPNFHVDRTLINEIKLGIGIKNTIKLISNGLKNKKEEA